MARRQASGSAAAVARAATLGRRTRRAASSRRVRRLGAVAAAALSLWTFVGGAAAQNDGLRPGAALGGPRWQLRFERDASSLPLRTQLNLPAAADAAPGATRAPQLRLLGDWQSDFARLGERGGLRLTGGLLLTPPDASSAGAPALPSTQGFAGVGWAWGRPGDGLSVGADVGVASTPLFGTAERWPQRLGPNAGERAAPLVRLGLGLAF